MANRKSLIWDLPTRLFHWSLAILVSISVYTGLTGGFKEMEYHMLSGYCILALVLFRICWGFLGSYHARFRNFVSVRDVLPYIRQILQRNKTSIGHNPLGAWNVIAMLTVLLVQAATGLFSDDDIMTEGPLTHLVTDDIGNELTGVHHLNAWLIYGLVGLHLAAISFYEIYHRDRLILPMITGRKREPSAQAAGSEPSVRYNIMKVVFLAAVCSGFVYYLVNEA